MAGYQPPAQPIQCNVVNPASIAYPDGASQDLLGGKAGEALVADYHSRWYTRNYRQRLFQASLTAASAFVAPATNATPNFILWNPVNSGVNLSIERFLFGYVSGTPAAGVIGYSYIPNAGASLGTAAPISALTAITIQGCTAGMAYNGKTLAGSAATVTGSAPSAAAFLRWSGISQGILASASIAPGLWMVDECEGNILVPPGTAIYPVCSAASVALYMVSAIWEECLI
jgi:hypothetical protein